MKNVLTAAGLMMAGWIVGTVIIGRDIDKGDVVYENDDMYVKATESKSRGWSFAEVHWKKPV